MTPVPRGMSSYISGQPLDHEPSLGQVPGVVPGLPPNAAQSPPVDTWLPPSHHQFGRLMGHYQPPNPPLSPSSINADPMLARLHLPLGPGAQPPPVIGFGELGGSGDDGSDGMFGTTAGPFQQQSQQQHGRVEVF